MKQLKRVLLVAPYGGVPGGISRWTGHIVDYYKHQGYKDCQLVLVATGRSMFVDINMPIWKRVWTAWIDYRKIFADFNQRVMQGHDVMHLTSSASLSLFKDLYMLRKAKRQGLKTILHFRFGRIPELANKNNWEWKLIKRAVRISDKVIVIDQSSYDTLIAQGFDNIVILPNPVAPAVEKIVEENINIEKVKGEILFTGHVVKTKGVFELLEACSALDNLHLKLVGHITSDVRLQIERLYGKYPVWLSICGEMPYEEVIKEMMKCDVFVLPTYTEGFPNVILEAMAAGCAIISTPVGAIPQMLEAENGKTYGVLVEQKNVSTLKQAISSILRDETLKNEMRENVRSRVGEKYNMQSIWNRMLTIWETC